MGIFDRFPYSSTHEMNLDYMLGKATEIAEDMQTVTTGMAQVQAGLSAISEKTEQATQAAAQAAESAEEAQMHNESAQTWANNALTYKADCQRAATEAAASSASAAQAATAADASSTAAAQAATAAAASEDTVATYAQAANASAQSAANNNDSAHQYANQANASATNAMLHSTSAQTAATNAQTAATNAETAATNAQTAATNAETAATNAETAATRAAALKDNCETLSRMCTTAVDQAAEQAVTAGNKAAQAAASADRAETLVESLPEDFTDLNNTVNNIIKVQGVMPESFGAIGDGQTDDTNALQDCFDYAFTNKLPVALTKSYFVTQSIDVHDWCYVIGNLNTNYNIIFAPAESSSEANMIPLFVCNDSTTSQYYHSFVNVSIKKNSGVCICFGNTCPIDHCSIVSGCNIFQFNVVFGCFIGHVSRIVNNKFTSVMYAFHTANITDSYIINNYISGYRPNAPYCFYGGQINHSEISGNFFDFWFGIFIFANNSKITNNIFDYCYMVFGYVDDYGARYIKVGSNIEVQFSSSVITENIFPNCRACNTDTVGFGSVKSTIANSYNGAFKIAMLEGFPPSAIFVAQVKVRTEDSALYPAFYYYTCNSVISDNCFSGDGIIMACTNSRGIIMRGNNYGIDSVTYNYIEDVPNIYISIADSSNVNTQFQKTEIDALTILPFRNAPLLTNNRHSVFGIGFGLALNYGVVYYNNRMLYIIHDHTARKIYDAMGNEFTNN